jgi:hypothetical protein
MPSKTKPNKQPETAKEDGELRKIVNLDNASFGSSPKPMSLHILFVLV